MDKDKALRMALEALESLQGGCTDSDDGTVEAITVWCPEVIDAIREALAQPEQEPVAWELRAGKTDRVLIEITNNPQRAHDWKASLEEVVPLYTTPPQPEQESDDLTAAYLSGVYDGKNKDAPQREWVGLTDEEIDIWNIVAPSRLRDFVRCIEAKLREKNGG